MNIYTLVQSVCNEKNFQIETAGVQRLVGTLRAAGFDYDVDGADAESARSLVAERLAAVMSPSLRTAASPTETPITSTAKFEEIDSFRSKNKCPRCKDSMEGVKLANYEKAQYCPRCRVALWQD